MFTNKKHNSSIYNNLLFLSRNIFFYRDLSLKDSYETRIFLMFMHYSIILITFKEKKVKKDQDNYNYFFKSVEYNLRELGYGDVSVNKKMKDLNKFFYDILLKINLLKNNFKLNKELVINYFNIFEKNQEKWKKFEDYFDNFYKFCFDISPEYMIEDIKKYKFNYGSS